MYALQCLTGKVDNANSEDKSFPYRVSWAKSALIATDNTYSHQYTKLVTSILNLP